MQAERGRGQRGGFRGGRGRGARGRGSRGSRGRGRGGPRGRGVAARGGRGSRGGGFRGGRGSGDIRGRGRGGRDRGGRGRGRGGMRNNISTRGPAPRARIANADPDNAEGYEMGTRLYKLIRKGNSSEFEKLLEELLKKQKEGKDNKNNSNNEDGDDLDSKIEELPSVLKDPTPWEDPNKVVTKVDYGAGGVNAGRKNDGSLLDYVIFDWKGSQFHDTLLIIASYYNNPEIIKLLLKYGSDINATDDYGRTALYWACRNDSLLIVSILLDYNGDPNLYNKDDNTTTLWFAGFNGNIAIMKQLIKYGFDYKTLINQSKNGTGYSVFHQVCEKGFLQCLKYLIKVCGCNAGIKKSNNNGDNLIGANSNIMVDNDSVIDIYLETTNHHMNGLMLACNNSNVNVVKYLVNQLNYLSKDGVINASTTNGKTAIWYGCLDGNLEIIQLLVKKSYEIFRKDNESITDDSKINEINKIDINKANHNGHTPLYVASMRNHYHCVEWLIDEENSINKYKYNIDVNKSSKPEKMTPLMQATKCGNLKSVEILSKCKLVKINDIKDKVGRTVFDYCAKFGQSNCLKIILKSLLSRLEINSWKKLEESGIITVKIIDNWIKLAKKYDKAAATSAATAAAAAQNRAFIKSRREEKKDDADGTDAPAADNGDDDDNKEDDKSKLQKKKRTKNDGIVHFLEELLTGCFKFNNFELLIARLDYNNNNLSKEEIGNKLKQCQKLDEMVNKLHKYCANKEILIEFSEIIIEMIKNKEIVNDTLLMIANKSLPDKLENVLVKSVKECISGETDDDAENSGKPKNATDDLLESLENDDMMTMANVQSNNNNTLAVDTINMGKYNIDENKMTDEMKLEIEERERALKKLENESRKRTNLRNIRDIQWYKECILNSNILTNIKLFEKIKLESIKQELTNQQIYLQKQIKYIKEINIISWKNLINFKSFNISLDNTIQQKRVISKFDNTSANMLANNGIPVEYEQKSLFIDYLTGFNMANEYDFNGYLVNMLIAAHKMNPLFQRHCRKLLSADILGVPCNFKRAPVKTKERCQLKATMDYSNREWPYVSHILDVLRCSVSFENPSDLIVGLNKFRTIMKQGLRQQKGCLVDIVRIKNGFEHYLEIEDNKLANATSNNIFSTNLEYDDYMTDDLSNYQYSDIKINVIVEIQGYKMISEIQFMLDFMTQAKEIGHIFYQFERNEDLYLSLYNSINEISESKNNISDEMKLSNEKYLKMIIGTRSYNLLLNYILFGRFENEICKRINKLNFKKLLNFCKENQWKEGFKLLKDALKHYKQKWWMPQNQNSYLMVNID